MVVASYQDEPMAHMVGAGCIASYIERLLQEPSADTTQPELQHGLGDSTLQRLLRGFARLPGGKRQGLTLPDLNKHSKPVTSDLTLKWRDTLSSDNSQDVRAALESRQINNMTSTEIPLPSPRLLLGLFRRGSGMSRRSPVHSESGPDEMALPRYPGLFRADAAYLLHTIPSVFNSWIKFGPEHMDAVLKRL